MKLIVTGTRGQVAASLLEVGSRHGHEVIAVGRPHLDLAHPETVADALGHLRADAIVSAAAYTAVDWAESEQQMAYAVNADGPRALAEAARNLKVPLIHLSTDYVFDGTKPAPYEETDPTAPLGVYGASKLAGEQAVAEVYGENSAILRTAWVYSPFGTNFVRTMLRLAGERDRLRVVADQFGNPTSALDIAEAVIGVADRLRQDPAAQLRGVFHMTATGETNWAEFARSVFVESAQLGGPSASVEAISTAEYPTPAKRPANSRLNCAKLSETYGISLPEWRRSLTQTVARLLA